MLPKLKTPEPKPLYLNTIPEKKRDICFLQRQKKKLYRLLKTRTDFGPDSRCRFYKLYTHVKKHTHSRKKNNQPVGFGGM